MADPTETRALLTDATAPATPEGAVLAVSDLRVRFSGRRGAMYAVNGIDFQVGAGETLAIVGESGCGKSVTAGAIMGLLPRAGTMVEGEILLDGRNLLELSERQMQDIRGNAVAQIFQEPMTALNPLLTIGLQIAEPLMRHRGMGRREALARASELLERVHVPDPESWLQRYPHEMSGGMRQRAMIAMALACGPKILIADEPTTALDVTIQAQILRLIAQLQDEFGTAVLLITHDLGVVAEVADRVMVLYAGTVVERASVRQLFAEPIHPYTRGLLAALPSFEAADDEEDLAEISGVVPALNRAPDFCPFAPRCSFAAERCVAERPPPIEVGREHWVACWFTDKVRESIRAA